MLDVVFCATAFQAACVECALWGLYAGNCKDYGRVRGANFCMLEPFCGIPPTGWNKNERSTVESIKRSLGEVDDIEDFPFAKRAA